MSKPIAVWLAGVNPSAAGRVRQAAVSLGMVVRPLPASPATAGDGRCIIVVEGETAAGSLLEVAGGVLCLSDAPPHALPVSAPCDWRHHDASVAELTLALCLLEKWMTGEAATNSNVDLGFRELSRIFNHDVKAPVRVAERFLSMFRERCTTEFPPDTGEFLEIAARNMAKAKRMIEELRLLSKLDEAPHAGAPVELDALVAEIRQELDERRMTVDAALHVGSLPVVCGDAEQLRVLFRELMVNALVFRAERPCEVSFEAVPKGDRWEFTLLDNGAGMPAELVAQAVLPFRQFDPERASGLGMGLALAKCVVRRHGGELTIQSTLDKGTAVRFSLQRDS